MYLQSEYVKKEKREHSKKSKKKRKEQKGTNKHQEKPRK
tara:strand:- start:322 stop:438 length:117 start_codon:yes stop_codon:yes gene_type:complete